jgi:hypothetical protein
MVPTNLLCANFCAQRRNSHTLKGKYRSAEGEKLPAAFALSLVAYLDLPFACVDRQLGLG